MSLSAELVRLDNDSRAAISGRQNSTYDLCADCISPLQKNERKALISLTRAQNCTHGKTVLSAHEPALPNGADCRQAPAWPRP
jgi:hypothetical protein